MNAKQSKSNYKTKEIPLQIVLIKRMYRQQKRTEEHAAHEQTTDKTNSSLLCNKTKLSNKMNIIWIKDTTFWHETTHRLFAYL